jgi:DNA-binding response OmpR family regulator
MSQLKRILVVDDEIMTRNLLFEVLSDRGFKVTLAKDGRDCLNQMKKNRFDLLITDIHMPRLDGIEMLRRMKRDKRREKVIVISGMAGEPIDLDRKDILPIFTMLQKPFQINRFLAAVLAVLAGSDKKQKKESLKAGYH